MPSAWVTGGCAAFPVAAVATPAPVSASSAATPTVTAVRRMPPPIVSTRHPIEATGLTPSTRVPRIGDG
ncbi:hypothetical protein GCM10023175_63280 [Pseudonocardia xishanensis]|uniref:Uncharacterized protein n=1 Tax=Pseudonocardia xishanensis TaxID=630995 RepID=A0ABP8S1F2_9PSEU